MSYYFKIYGEDTNFLLYYGTNTKHINIYQKSKKICTVNIQNPSNFRKNLLSVIERLKSNEIDEFSYQPSKNESIIFKIDKKKIGAHYSTDSKDKFENFKEFLRKLYARARMKKPSYIQRARAAYRDFSI
jgi:hypothetical protein